MVRLGGVARKGIRLTKFVNGMRNRWTALISGPAGCYSLYSVSSRGNSRNRSKDRIG